MTVPCPVMDRADTPRVVIVVPTLGQRIDYLTQTLDSITRQSVPAQVVMVCPTTAHEARRIGTDVGAGIVDDPGSLPAAINFGVAATADHDYVTWLGDDDLLEPDSLQWTVSALDQKSDAVLAYGWCRYIDPSGRRLWVNKSGSYAEALLSWGPQLIPQPGMLVRRRAWDRVGGLDESLRMAFDFDLILKLRDIGEFTCVNRTVSAFRWHPQSLTVSSRTENLDESQSVKRRYLSRRQRQFAWVWESPVRLAIRIAAWNVDRKARSIMNRSAP